MSCLSIARLTRLAARLGAALVLLPGLGLMGGCADASYYLQSAQGHMALMRVAKPVDDWIADPQTPAELKARLALSQQIRRFAVTDFGLPDNASDHRYADLHSKHRGLTVLGGCCGTDARHIDQIGLACLAVDAAGAAEANKAA